MQSTRWTFLSITPWCSTNLGTEGPVCYHALTDETQTHWNTCSGYHFFLYLSTPIHTHIHAFPLLLALSNPTYTLLTPASLVTFHLPDQGQLSRPTALDVEALTQHGHLCLSREISTRQGQGSWAPCGSMLSQPLSMSVLSLLILSQTTPHVCRPESRKSCNLNMSGRQICENSWGMLARESNV